MPNVCVSTFVQRNQIKSHKQTNKQIYTIQRLHWPGKREPARSSMRGETLECIHWHTHQPTTKMASSGKREKKQIRFVNSNSNPLYLHFVIFDLDWKNPVGDNPVNVGQTEIILTWHRVSQGKREREYGLSAIWLCDEMHCSEANHGNKETQWDI